MLLQRDPMIDQAAQQPQALDVVLDVTEAQWSLCQAGVK